MSGSDLYMGTPAEGFGKWADECVPKGCDLFACALALDDDVTPEDMEDAALFSLGYQSGVAHVLAMTCEQKAGGATEVTKVLMTGFEMAREIVGDMRNSDEDD